MTSKDYTPLYQYEDDLVTVSVGKPGAEMGGFIALDGNIQFGFMDNQFSETLIPLLESIVNETVQGKYKFYKCQSGNYRLQNGPLMLVIKNASAVALKHHALKALSMLIPNSNIE